MTGPLDEIGFDDAADRADMERLAGGLPPNPGSDAAVGQGCICAVLDNNHGRFSPWPPDGWWITEGCPVHSFPEKVASRG